MAGQPKAPFFAVLALIVAGLVALAVWQSPARSDRARGRQAGPNQPQKIDPKQLGQKAEAADEQSVTTVKEYTFHPGEKLPPVKGISAYEPLKDNTRAVRPERLGRLGADHPGQQRLQGPQGLEDARRAGVQGRAGADRRPRGDARRSTRPARSTSAGARWTWCRCSSHGFSRDSATAA